MGNSNIGALKAAISDDNDVIVQEYISNPQLRPLLDAKLNRKGDSAILYCARHDRLRLLRLLVDAGCDVQAFNREGNNALDVSSLVHFGCVPM